jgi:uncharacterized protein YfcZ (UPF0381/DUF406 family)
MDDENKLEYFLDKLRRVDSELATGKQDVSGLLLKIEFTFIMLANNMGYLDSEDWL